MEQWQKISQNTTDPLSDPCVSVLNNLSCYWAIYHLSAFLYTQYFQVHIRNVSDSIFLFY